MNLVGLSLELSKLNYELLQIKNESESYKARYEVQQQETTDALIASTELFELILDQPEAVNLLERRAGTVMIKIYATLITKGEKTIEQVPLIIRQQVEDMLQLTEPE